MAIHANFAPQGFQSFFYDYWKHNESGDRIGPPPTKDSIHGKTGQQYGREIGANGTLARISGKRPHCLDG
jgi:hypothetical protein